MNVLAVFLRNLIVILFVGGVGFGVVSLPFDPLLTAGGYAALLAVLMTWLELSPPAASQSNRKPRQAKAAKSRPRRQDQATGKSTSPGDGVTVAASLTSPAGQTEAPAPQPKRRPKRQSQPSRAGQQGEAT